MKNKKLRILTYGIAALVFLIVAILYPRLPDQIPTHWNFDGSVTYGSRSNIWSLTAMLPRFAILFDIMPHIDPRRQNYQRFSRFYDGFCVGMQLFLAIVIGILIRESFFPGQIQVTRIIVAMLAVMFLLIGNYLPKVQSNFYMGIKNPWTLSSDAICGIFTLLSSLILPVTASGVILLILIIGSTLVVTLASWLWWRKEQN